jgi:tRNA-dihydrouridine synthase B
LNGARSLEGPDPSEDLALADARVQASGEPPSDPEACAGGQVCVPSGDPAARFLATPFSVGGLRVPNRVVSAPMAGLTNSAYRRHLKAHGVGLVTSEMISAYGIIHSNARTAAYLDFTPQEQPIAVQLFGDSPDVMARATETVLSRAKPPDAIDINMGCPVRKVMRTGAGAAFLGEPDRAVAVTAAVVRAASQAGVPVTVKLRSGLRAGERTAASLAPRLEEVGVKSLALHPRAAEQHYRGTADHAVTKAVVDAVGVPVIASGDIYSLASALSALERTGAAAVMVARGVAGNPWLVGALLSGRSAARPSLHVVVDDLRRLLRSAAAELGPERAARWIRKLLGWYLRPSGVPVSTVHRLRFYGDATALDIALAQVGAGEI